MNIPALYLISSSANSANVQQYLSLHPIALVVATEYAALSLAKTLSQRVVFDTTAGQVARYLKVATETYDSPIALVGDFSEPITALPPEDDESTQDK